MQKSLLSILSCFIILVGTVLPSIHVSANQKDTSPPIVESIEISPREAKVGDTVTVKIKVADDKSGIEEAYALYKSQSIESTPRRHLNLTYDSDQKLWIGSFKVEDNFQNGTWFIDVVNLIDKSYNKYSIKTEDFPNEVEPYFIIHNENGDWTPPILESIEISPREVSVGGTITVKVKAIDNKSGIEKAYINYQYQTDKSNNSRQLYLEYDSKQQLWIGSFTVKENDLDGVWKVTDVYLADKLNNYSYINSEEFPKDNPTEFIIHNENGDWLPPVLEGIEVSPKEAKVGDIVTVKIKATDDKSGLQTVSLGYKYKALESSPRWNLDLSYDSEQQLWIGSFRVMENYQDGSWTIDEVNLMDRASNYINLGLKEFPDGTIADFTIQNENKDWTPPVLESIEVSPREVNVGERVTVKVKAQDNESGIDRVTIAYASQSLDSNTTMHLDLNYDSDQQLWIGNFIANKNYPDGIWKITEVFLMDKVYNQKNFSSKEFPNEAFVEFTIHNENGDWLPPVLEGIEISSRKAEVGETVTVKAKATDDKSGIKSINVFFKAPSYNISFKGRDLSLTYDEGSKEWIGSFKVGNDDEQGIWQVESIGISDKKNNYQSYSRGHFLLNNIDLEIINPATADINDYLAVEYLGSIGEREDIGFAIKTIHPELIGRDLHDMKLEMEITKNNQTFKIDGTIFGQREENNYDPQEVINLYAHFQIPQQLEGGTWKIKTLKFIEEDSILDFSKFHESWFFSTEFFVPEIEADEWARSVLNSKIITGFYSVTSIKYVDEGFGSLNRFIERYQYALPPYVEKVTYSGMMEYADKTGDPYGEEINLYSLYKEGLIYSEVEPRIPIQVYNFLPEISLDADREVRWYVTEVLHYLPDIHNANYKLSAYFMSPTGKEYKIENFAYDKMFDKFDLPEYKKGGWVGSFHFPENAVNGEWKINKVVLETDSEKVVFLNGRDFYGASTIVTDGQDGMPPEAPKVNKVTNQSTKVTGTAKTGLIVTVKDEGDKLGSAHVQEDGTFVVDIKPQKAGTVLSVTVEDQVGNNSIATNITVDSVTRPNNSGGGSSSGDSVTPSAPTVELEVNKDSIMIAPELTVNDGTATTTISLTDADKIIENAVKNETKDILIKPAMNGEANKVVVQLPKTAVSDIAKRTNAELTISTPVGNVSIPNAALSKLGTEKGNTITVSIGKKDVDTITIKVKSDNKVIDSISRGITVTVPVEKVTVGTVAVIVKEDDMTEIIKKSATNDGNIVVPLDGSATFKIIDNSKSFEDVQPNDWHYDAVTFAAAHELFNGTANDSFSPHEEMTRGMLVTVLHRLENAPAGSKIDFSDVGTNAYYADAVAWSSRNNIINGYSNGLFAPNDDITREQIAAILYRYAKAQKLDVTTSEDLDSFTDSTNISNYAREAMQWAVGKELISGKKNNILDPKAKATRAEVATILMRFIGKTVE